ncbi:hypothetical protein FXN63_07335 [Pigmentiphaga aceris]|uniref:DUF416 family protein n=1 Tax=Pigmentiphaga aceris TaxID=1940612 RepID=A0A5C0AVP5_9BURK|nr:hypothetical protein [Pigmentiphaga aceris]QEI05674.1 hypothetical protein FXN63_07335 [Pigmentiphaga aceris]
MTDTLINTLSVVAKQCVAVTCLERFCRQFQIEHPALFALVEHIWKVAQVEPANFVAWESGFASLPISGLGDDWPQEVQDAIPQKVLQPLNKLVDHVVETSAVTWYGNDLPATTRQLQNVLEICKVHGVTTPELRQYIQLQPEIHGGWGPPLTDQELAAWRALA